ncbi:hypothetical protein ACQ4M4_06185 [Leptolyngbya sp. AN02str]|uniref:hypothetical protein n=1 Tax=Leptolyngbya sp. AN02str TaxID=3423363 RepID=UPI003D31E412
MKIQRSVQVAIAVMISVMAATSARAEVFYPAPPNRGAPEVRGGGASRYREPCHVSDQIGMTWPYINRLIQLIFHTFHTVLSASTPLKTYPKTLCRPHIGRHRVLGF